MALALDGHRHQWWWPPARHLPAPHRLHLTLHALGRLDDAQIDAVQHALQGLHLQCFDLHLDWSGVWPHNGVAVACPQPNAALDRLRTALARALHLPLPDGAWSPHVTLAWRAWHAAAAPFSPLRWPVRECALVRSWLPPHAVRHEVLARYPLGDGCAGSWKGAPSDVDGRAGPLDSSPSLD